MAGYNRVIMVGNLTRDPELRQLQSGAQICRLSIASNRQFKDRQTGATNQEVCFIDVDVWGAQAESCKQYLQKGRPVLVEGRLKLDNWKDAEGQPRSKYSIVASMVQFLSFGGANAETETGVSDMMSESTDAAFEASAPKPAAKRAAKKLSEPPFDDELPF